ncbi:MAG: hypothetical protein RL172_470 [Bacteroidota bacterium]
MRIFFTSLLFIVTITVYSQTPQTFTSSEILQQLKRLNVLGSVLYIAAHPDDENTRLLGYLANEKLYRTGYLSLTRGDGGQNLIGDEQGIDLGLIRTQELLAARRVDGAEQFFSRAYDFGFSKSSEEALAIWGHDKILSDVVWVVRNFKPDVIIARFPEDSRAGHGHHAASGILAREAFDAAADPTKFPEQLKNGVTVWQAKRMLWNTFNFGGNITQNENQFKMDVGMYNPLLGKSYGEIAAISRSQHKSQGFGVPAQRGAVLEYFETIRGDKPVTDIMEGVNTGWSRLAGIDDLSITSIQGMIDSAINNFSHVQPDKSFFQLMRIRQQLVNEAARASLAKNDFSSSYGMYFVKKIQEVDAIIGAATGIFMEATAASQLNTVGDSIKTTISFNNRMGIDIENVQVAVFGKSIQFAKPQKNVSLSQQLVGWVPPGQEMSQPYWLEYDKTDGAFVVKDQYKIGHPQLYLYQAVFTIHTPQGPITYTRPVQYKYTDAVKGEIYQPIQLVPPFYISSSPSLLLFNTNGPKQKKQVEYLVQSNLPFKDSVVFNNIYNGHSAVIMDSLVSFKKADKLRLPVTVTSDAMGEKSTEFLSGELVGKSLQEHQYYTLSKISYDHIPDIFYHYRDMVKVIKLDLKTAGTTVGYIAGAGDRVPQALEQMGYKVTMLKENDITAANIKQFSAIVTGIRAYNTNEWMNNVYDVLMQYVNEGGVLLTQYNTSSQIGPVKAKMAPYPFNISRTRITDEHAAVRFLQPTHPALNYPNKITEKDFDGWIQERSIYHADKIDSSYQRIISMKDPGEKEEQDGSLIVANYGKGKFVYTGLVFFRQLPAGVHGAYRLLANLLAPLPVPGQNQSGNKSPKTALQQKSKLSGKSIHQ